MQTSTGRNSKGYSKGVDDWTLYDKQGLGLEARAAVKGRGRFTRWELKIGPAVVLLAYYRTKEGCELCTTVAI